MRMKKTIPALPVQDITSAIGYYSEKLGFTARHQEADFAILVRDDVEIHIWKSGDESWRNRGGGLISLPICSGAESFLAGTASCRIEVQGIEQLYQEYREKGALHSPHTVVTEQPWGNREFEAVDNYGNLLTFFEE
ncbi:MAG: VOC family protein [Sphingobacteriales bacterium]|nr:MAG: VOC family protein [Sphingobacteriales bacterium]